MRLNLIRSLHQEIRLIVVWYRFLNSPNYTKKVLEFWSLVVATVTVVVVAAVAVVAVVDCTTVVILKKITQTLKEAMRWI